MGNVKKERNALLINDDAESDARDEYTLSAKEEEQKAITLV